MEIINVGGNRFSKKIRFKFIQKLILKNKLKMSGRLYFMFLTIFNLIEGSIFQTLKIIHNSLKMKKIY